MAWKIEIERQAEKELNRLDRVAAKRIIAFLVTLGDSDDPRSTGKQLRGSELWRYRVGHYRIICKIQDDVLVVLVLRIRHRKNAYQNLS